MPHPYLQDRGFMAFAHRGANITHPENTLAAFETAVNLGYRYAETDVHLSRDGVLVAFHDDRLDRLTDREGAIADLDWSEIQQAKVGGREPIPRLTDILTYFPDLRITIEPKSDSAVLPLLAAVDQLDVYHRVCIGSFSGARLKTVRQIGGEKICTSHGPLDVAKLRFNSWGLPIKGFPGQCMQIPTHQYGIRLIDARFLKAAHRHGLKVHVWTINDAEEMKRLIELGVDGLMSDDAQLLKSVLLDLGLWNESD